MGRRLTVLMVGAFPFPLGQGSQVYAASQLSGLVARGHRAIVVSYPGPGAPVPGVTHWPTGRMPTAVLRSGPHWTRLPLDLWLVRRVRQALKRFPVDVIHAHNVEAPILSRLASPGRTGPPVVYDLHTEMAAELPTYANRFEGWWSAVGRGADAWAARASDAGIAISAQAQAWFDSRGIPSPRVGPGVDVDDLRRADGAGFRQRWGLRDEACVVYTGSTDAFQDLPILYRAMVDVPARLVVSTQTDPERVRRSARAHGLNAICVVPGDWATTRDAIAGCQLAAIPRRACTGFPIKLLNCLGLGLPTVCAEGSAQDIPGVVRVRGGDPEALATELRALLGDSARRETLSTQAWMAVEIEWSVAAAAARLEQAYLQILTQRGCV